MGCLLADFILMYIYIYTDAVKVTSKAFSFYHFLYKTEKGKTFSNYHHNDDIQ